MERVHASRETTAGSTAGSAETEGRVERRRRIRGSREMRARGRRRMVEVGGRGGERSMAGEVPTCATVWEGKV